MGTLPQSAINVTTKFAIGWLIWAVLSLQLFLVLLSVSSGPRVCVWILWLLSSTAVMFPAQPTFPMSVVGEDNGGFTLGGEGCGCPSSQSVCSARIEGSAFKESWLQALPGQGVLVIRVRFWKVDSTRYCYLWAPPESPLHRDCTGCCRLFAWAGRAMGELLGYLLLVWVFKRNDWSLSLSVPLFLPLLSFYSR